MTPHTHPTRTPHAPHTHHRNWTTSAAVESLHSRLQLARSRARGFRNFTYFQTVAYWIAGGLKPASGLPDPIPSSL